jgi:hypothetical protein
VFGYDALVIVECDSVARWRTYGGLSRWPNIPVANPEIELAKPRIMPARKDYRVEGVERDFPLLLTVKRLEVPICLEGLWRNRQAIIRRPAQFGKRRVNVAADREQLGEAIRRLPRGHAESFTIAEVSLGVLEVA